METKWQRITKTYGFIYTRTPVYKGIEVYMIACNSKLPIVSTPGYKYNLNCTFSWQECQNNKRFNPETTEKEIINIKKNIALKTEKVKNTKRSHQNHKTGTLIFEQKP